MDRELSIISRLGFLVACALFGVAAIAVHFAIGSIVAVSVCAILSVCCIVGWALSVSVPETSDYGSVFGPHSTLS